MSEPQLQLFVRSLRPAGSPGRQQRVLDGLNNLDATGRIAGYEVTVWGDAVAHDAPIADTDAARAVRDRVGAFRDWAAEHGVDVDRFYETRAVQSSLADTDRRETTLPAMALAESRDGDLARVTPHVDAGEVMSVSDHLASLAGDDVGPDATEPTAQQAALD